MQLDTRSKISSILQIPLARVHPIVNYHNDREIDWKKSFLIVHALKDMRQCATDYVKEQAESDKLVPTVQPKDAIPPYFPRYLQCLLAFCVCLLAYLLHVYGWI